MEKNWDEVTSWVPSLTQKRAKRKMSLKGQAEVVNAYFVSVIYYHLTIIPCPAAFWLTKLMCLLFCILWKGHILLVRCSFCC